MKTTVLDASALLALFFDEPGAAMAEAIIHRATEADRPLLISAVNWAEVCYRVESKRGAAGLIDARLFAHNAPLAIVPADQELAEAAAHYKAAGVLGLADAFAAALAKLRKAELVTSDREFKSVESEIKITWLGTK